MTIVLDLVEPAVAGRRLLRAVAIWKATAVGSGAARAVVASCRRGWRRCGGEFNGRVIWPADFARSE